MFLIKIFSKNFFFPTQYCRCFLLQISNLALCDQSQPLAGSDVALIRVQMFVIAVLYPACGWLLRLLSEINYTPYQPVIANRSIERLGIHFASHNLAGSA
jgi:hypothetical protein